MNYSDVLQGLVSNLGRDDIGVGDVDEADGKLLFTLTRGDLSYRAEMPVALLSDRELAMSAMMAIIPKLSKAVEREHIEAARRAD